jgi:hypothetical protein
MPTINARLMQIVRPMPAIFALMILATPAAAQRSVAPGTPVRITLADQQVVEGQLLSGDASSLTVRTELATVAVPRQQIASMSAKIATRSARYAGRLGLLSAGAGAAFFSMLAQGICESQSGCDNAAVDGGLIGGGFGLVTGGAAGAVFGALFHDWKSVPASVAVNGREFGALATERCVRNPGIAVEGGLGQTNLHGASKRIGVTLLCRSAFSVGAEVTSLGSGTNPVSTQAEVGTTSTFVSHTRARTLSFKGGFVELPFGGRLNPRLIASAGAYQRTETNAMYTSIWDGKTSQYSTSTATEVSMHPGGSLGLSISMPLWKYLSLGTDARVHFMTGASSISTLGVTLKVRP